MKITGVCVCVKGRVGERHYRQPAFLLFLQRDFLAVLDNGDGAELPLLHNAKKKQNKSQ